MRRFILQHRLSLAMGCCVLMFGYLVLAVAFPAVATAVGVGAVAFVLAASCAIRIVVPHEMPQRRR